MSSSKSQSQSQSQSHDPPDGSWRLVDGENDSFDTTILPASSPPSSPQMFFSQSLDAIDSQHSIRDFENYRDDENVILREPFLPTLPPLRPILASDITARRSLHEDEAPQLRLRLPSFDSNGNLTGSTFDGNGNLMDIGGSHDVPTTPDTSIPRKRKRQEFEEDLAGPVPLSLFNMVRLVFNYIRAPIALLLAIYFLYSCDISFQIVSNRFDTVSLAPLCRLPGASRLNLSSCQLRYSGIPHGAAVYSANFNDVMDVQARFENVLDKSQHGLAMPLELKRSEMATRSLRNLLKDSNIPSRDVLISELNSYVDKVGRAGSDLQTFYIHVGSTVDAVINVNRWTLRHINSLAIEPETPEFLAWIIWLANPFRPSRQAFNHRVLLDKYVKHIILVQDHLARLIDEGVALSMLLYHSQNHLAIIYDYAKRSSTVAGSKPDSLLSGIWGYIGGMILEQSELDEQISLLKKVDLQYASTISHLLSLIERLKDIRAGLVDLLQRGAEPPVFGAHASLASQPTLDEQIEILKSGVKRLEGAKRRARGEAMEEATEDEGGSDTVVHVLHVVHDR